MRRSILLAPLYLLACAVEPNAVLDASSRDDAASADGATSTNDVGFGDIGFADTGPTIDAGAADAGVVGDAGAGPFMVTVHAGFGSGAHQPGDTVHVFADLVASGAILSEWRGDVALLERPQEWHTTFTMPARDVTVTAVTATRTLALESSVFRGTTTHDKRARWFVPPNPRALMLMLHGTGGSADFINRTEAEAVALAAIERGYAVASYEAEEVAAGDLDGDQKIRWDADRLVTNVDFANLDALIRDIRARGAIAADLPLVVMGMSNGGSMSVSLGGVSAIGELAAAFGALRFAAAASYCASGRITAALQTLTPTAWYLCRRDTHPQVGEQGNMNSETNSAALARRGVATEVAYHEPSPIYDERFTRVSGIDRATSTAIVGELRNAGFVDPDGILNAPVADVVRAFIAAPASFPMLRGLDATAKRDVSNQISAVYADHTFFSDLTEQMLDFFDAQL